MAFGKPKIFTGPVDLGMPYEADLMAPFGLAERGNIDLYNRPSVMTPEGEPGTVRSIGVNINGREVLIPTIVDGKLLSDVDAIEKHRETGKHLGAFDSVENANRYAKALSRSMLAGRFNKP